MVRKYLNHRRNKKTPQLYIFTNGITEKNYFESLLKDLELSTKIYKVESLDHNTLSLVKKVYEIQQQERISCPIWIVFDYDDAKCGQFDNAIAKAKRHNFHLAYSNDCFELWFLLHESLYKNSEGREKYFEKMTEILNQKGVKGEKGRKFSNYKKNGKTLDLYPLFKEQTNNAIKNAKKLEQSWEERNEIIPSRQRPSTKVHNLVSELLVL